MFKVDKQDSEIWGLSYIPRLVEHRNDIDQIHGLIDHSKKPSHFSECNENTLRAVIERIRPHVIFEIGVDRPTGSSRSTTATILDARPDGCVYVGIDRDVKTVSGDNVFLQHQSSDDFDSIAAFMEAHGIEEIDLLMIDGFHSVDMCINDWQYTRWLSKSGAVVLHDTNGHPGPVVLFDAIDETLFTKEKYCLEGSDYGISVAIRKKV